MKWAWWLQWRHPQRDETERVQIERARVEAERAVADVQARWPAVNETVAAKHARLYVNHIGPLIEEALGARSERRKNDG